MKRDKSIRVKLFPRVSSSFAARTPTLEESSPLLMAIPASPVVRRASLTQS